MNRSYTKALNVLYITKVVANSEQIRFSSKGRLEAKRPLRLILARMGIQFKVELTNASDFRAGEEGDITNC